MSISDDVELEHRRGVERIGMSAQPDDIGDRKIARAAARVIRNHPHDRHGPEYLVKRRADDVNEAPVAPDAVGVGLSVVQWWEEHVQIDP